MPSELAVHRDGQISGFEIAMTIICPHCHAGYYARGASNSIRKDGRWLNGDMASATHLVAGKRRKCRAAKLIPLLLMLYPTAAPPEDDTNG